MVKIDTELDLYKDQIGLMAKKVRKMYVLALDVLEKGIK